VWSLCSGKSDMRVLQTVLLVVVAFVCTRADLAGAQPYPSRSIQLVVTVPPGGAADFVARLVGAKLAEALGQSVIIVNRGGAAGTTAVAGVAKSEPDGYTLLLNTIATHGIGPHFYANLPYDPVKDFAPVILLAKLSLIMTVTSSLPAQSVGDVVALAHTPDSSPSPRRAREEHFTLQGPIQDLDGCQHPPCPITVAAARTRRNHVRCRSFAAAVHHVRCASSAGGGQPGASSAASAYADLRRTRLPADGHLAVVRHRLIVRRLNAELIKILDMPEIRKSFADQGADIEDTFMRDEQARWGALIKQAGIKAE
jgi:Tripartite tricarboxylate transporter family receptor